jgi:hypothetical protein
MLICVFREMVREGRNPTSSPFPNFSRCARGLVGTRKWLKPRAATLKMALARGLHVDKLIKGGKEV